MKPVSIDQLASMYDSSVVNEFDHIMWRVLMFSFRSLLLKSNVIPDLVGNLQHVVRRKDIEFKP